MLDAERQEFYRKALTTLTTSVPSAFVVILGLGSVLPMLTAKHYFQGMLLESSEKLGKLAEELLTNNQNENFEVGIVKALDDTGKNISHTFKILTFYLTFFFDQHWFNMILTCFQTCQLVGS